MEYCWVFSNFRSLTNGEGFSCQVFTYCFIYYFILTGDSCRVCIKLPNFTAASTNVTIIYLKACVANVRIADRITIHGTITCCMKAGIF